MPSSKSIAPGLRPNGRVVVIERLLPDEGAAGLLSLADLNMLVVLPGRERTLREYADLFARATAFSTSDRASCSNGELPHSYC
ncbi:MAG: methyltransferase [Xanthobacteraceae bacterium]